MIELRVKQSLMVYDDPERVSAINEEITGIAAQHERGGDEMEIKLLQGDEELGLLRMDIETAKMVRSALQTFSILE